MRQKAEKFSAGVVALFSVVMLCVGSARAQVDTGSIVGTVADPSGAVVPGATVTVINTGTAYTLTATTNSTGTYQFTPIRIGTYTVQVQATGFATNKRSDIDVHVQQEVVVDVILQPGTVTQVVEVTGGLLCSRWKEGQSAKSLRPSR